MEGRLATLEFIFRDIFSFIRAFFFLRFMDFCLYSIIIIIFNYTVYLFLIKLCWTLAPHLSTLMSETIWTNLTEIQYLLPHFCLWFSCFIFYLAVLTPSLTQQDYAAISVSLSSFVSSVLYYTMCSLFWLRHHQLLSFVMWNLLCIMSMWLQNICEMLEFFFYIYYIYISNTFCK